MTSGYGRRWRALRAWFDAFPPDDQERLLGRLQTLCDDGTMTTSYWNRTLSRWERTVTPPPGKVCTGQLHSKTPQVEGRCR